MSMFRLCPTVISCPLADIHPSINFATRQPQAEACVGNIPLVHLIWKWMQVLTRVNDGQCAHPVVFAAGCTKLNVVSTVVVDTSLGQHGIVLNLRFPEQSRQAKDYSQQQIHNNTLNQE